METMEAHIDQLETQLQRWAARLDELAARIDAAAELQLEYHSGIDNLKAKYELARVKLDALRTSDSAVQYEALNAGVESTWCELEAAFRMLTGEASPGTEQTSP